MMARIPVNKYGEGPIGMLPDGTLNVYTSEHDLPKEIGEGDPADDPPAKEGPHANETPKG